MRERVKHGAWAVAFCALMAALGTVIMAAGGLIPIATYCSPMLAAALLLPVQSELGDGRAWMTWAVTAALSLMLSVDREAAFFYLFIGYYPIIQPYINAVKAAPLRFLIKLLFFAAALGAMYALLLWVLQLDTLLEDFGSAALWMNLLFFVGLVAVMLLFDLALGRLRLVWLYRLRPKLKLPKK